MWILVASPLHRMHGKLLAIDDGGSDFQCNNSRWRQVAKLIGKGVALK
jgi:hypothetical protein